MSDWRPGDTAYRAMWHGYGRPEIIIQSATVEKVNGRGLWLSARELAWGCVAIASPSLMSRTRDEAVDLLLSEVDAEIERAQGVLDGLREKHAAIRKAAFR